MKFVIFIAAAALASLIALSSQTVHGAHMGENKLFTDCRQELQRLFDSMQFTPALERFESDLRAKLGDEKLIFVEEHDLEGVEMPHECHEFSSTADDAFKSMSCESITSDLIGPFLDTIEKDTKIDQYLGTSLACMIGIHGTEKILAEDVDFDDDF